MSLAGRADQRTNYFDYRALSATREPAYISENFLGPRLAGSGPRQGVQARAPPHHPVQVAPFEPVDERFPDPIRGA